MKSEEIISKLQYTAKTRTTGGRDGGRSLSSDECLDVQLERPGSSDGGTDPEQVVCHWLIGMLPELNAPRGLRDEDQGSECVAIDAEVDLCKGDHGYFRKHATYLF
jgi:osmotically inducible protein OsmC